MSSDRLKLRATIIGSKAAFVVANSYGGRVHSCFKRTVNLLLEEGLVGISSTRVPKSPINIQIELPNGIEVSSLDVKAGNRVKVERVSLTTSNLCILLNEAEIWNPSKSVDNASLELVKRNIELMQRFFSFFSINEGFGPILTLLPKILKRKREQSSSSLISGAILNKLSEIVNSITNKDLDSLGRACEGMVGLGSGATPSGDDFLMGLMASMQWTVRSFGGDLNYVEALCREISSRCNNTTELSKALLVCAAEGEVNEVIEKVLRSLFSGTKSQLMNSLMKLLRMGETSGVDTLAGIYLGVSLGLKFI